VNLKSDSQTGKAVTSRMDEVINRQLRLINKKEGKSRIRPAFRRRRGIDL